MNQIIDFLHNFPFVVSIISLIIGFLFMPVVIDIAKKYNFVVSPNKRTSHSGEIPNVGGINIFISFLLTVFLFTTSLLSNLQFILLGLFIILIVGFIDDLITIKVFWKLFGELLAGFFLIVISDIRISSLHGFLGIHEIPFIWSYLLSMFVFVVVVNAMNLIDGIDGLASGLGILYSLFFGVYFYLTDHNHLALTAFAMVGSLVVFFFYNVFSKQKKIFMGDSGSLLLGYIIIVFVFSFFEMNANGEVPEKFHMIAAPAVAFSVLIVPLFDTLRVMITRMKKGQSPFKADRNHVHHLMLSLGLKHRSVSFILMGISIIFIIIAILGRNLPNGVLAFIVLFLSSLLTKWLWTLVDKKNFEKSKPS
ncbi:MAG: undecaprenyl/decaprenyl-phosphate alpha-N-acetylglucosaminyl 1-phosphate transferase [Porphyromonadaceae bacterium]|nr:undecaprenyl/decaprenyl-phosphate alpha-N-acetylglucosaminyl 1-phosphate transferase [Porphyromonadaceae bacterium]